MLNKNSQTTTDLITSNTSKIRFEYLDGLRGIAALYVILFHIYLDFVDSGRQLSLEIPHSAYVATDWFLNHAKIRDLFLSHGKSSVVIFIVLSGYCLMLPVARSANGQLRGGVLNYIKRRAWRILPPYYAALVLSLLFSAFIPKNLMPTTGWHWNSGQPAFTPGALLSHFLLLHNLSHKWIFSINPPMWSVALEWQIYFIFAALLLPVWRRFGIIFTLLFACVSSTILGIHLTSWWYIILFTLGMTGAVIGFSRKSSLLKWKEKISWDLFANTFGVAWTLMTVCFCFKFLPFNPVNEIIKDLLLGVTVTCLIISCTRFLIEGNNTCFRGILHLLSSHWATTLGTFSYSLYLVHAVVIALVEFCLNDFNLSPTVRFLTLTVLVMPLSVLGAYGFHLIFEKPFMSGNSFPFFNKQRKF